MRFSKIILTLSLTILVAFQMSAQNDGRINRAASYYDKFDFETAADIYKKVIDKDPTNLVAKQKLADCYRLMNKPVEAEYWYSTLVGIEGTDVMNKYYYAQMLRANGKYDDAKKYYREYMALRPSDSRTKSIILGIDYLDALSRENTMYEVKLAPFNSKQSDFGPSIIKDEVLFTSNRPFNAAIARTDLWTEEVFLQMYKVKADESGNYGSPELFDKKKVNGKFHDGPVGYDPFSQDIYVTRSNYDNKPIKSTDNTVKLKLFRLVYVPETQSWGEKLVQDFPYNSDQYSCAHATVSRDGQRLYFASDMPGGEGGSDIYVCKKEGNVWGTPTNLKMINTEGDEMFPYIASDNTLYFASDGQMGLGGLDVYQVSVDEATGEVGKLANLGSPVNSQYDDFAYVINPTLTKGFFTSNRTNGVGDDDIYEFTKEGILLSGTVYDLRTNEKLPNSLVRLYDGNALRGETYSDANGFYSFYVEPNKAFDIKTTKDKYLPSVITVDVKKENITQDIPLKKEGGLELLVTVIDKNTQARLPGSDVILTNRATGQEARKVTNAEGQELFVLEPNQEYDILASKSLNSDEERYLNNTSSVSTKGLSGNKRLETTIPLERVKKNVAIKIDNIYYDLDKYDIRPDAAVELNKLVKIMKDNPTLEIELGSHTDCRSSEKYNMWLSAKRAESAMNYIIRQGITPYRIIAAGYGETRPVNDCRCEGSFVVPCTEQQYQDNRRTEFKILKF